MMILERWASHQGFTYYSCEQCLSSKAFKSKLMRVLSPLDQCAVEKRPLKRGYYGG